MLVALSSFKKLKTSFLKIKATHVIGVDHVALVVLLGVKDRADGHAGREDVPEPVGGQDEALVLQNVEVNNVKVRIRTDDVGLVLIIVAPQVPEGPGDSQKRDLIDVGRSPDRSLVSMSGAVPGTRLVSVLVRGLLNGAEKKAEIDSALTVKCCFWAAHIGFAIEL